MLFDVNKAAGFFMGLEEGGLSFGAEITLTYNADYQSLPMIGVYVIIELGRSDEAILGRITAVSSHGRLASSAGEDIGARSVEQRREMPEDIKKQFLRYRCSVRLLGLLREQPNGDILFTPSHRRLPHMGAKVLFADDRVLRSAAGALRPGEPIGFLAYGEFIYAQGHPFAGKFSANFNLMAPIVEPRFDAGAMVSRRTAVLARSGYGKSNLLKILFARLYEKGSPTLPDRQGGTVPVGTLVFDPDGDYFWPGAGGNSPPGLCDIPALADQIVLATDRPGPAPYYDSFRLSGARLDLRELPPSMVASCAISGERQGQRGTEALYRMRKAEWVQLVDAATLDHQGAQGTLSLPLVQQLCRLGNGASTEAIAAGIRSTMLDLVAKLHDPNSRLIQTVMRGLSDGKLVIVDLSLMRGQPATSTAAILLRYIFEFNVAEHTKSNGRPLPVIALIEEAQKVLESGDTSHGPFIEWVKEGRKYGLGGVLVTQQPGAIDNEILSQTDNFFVFHLVSGSDLNALKQANGHFTEDILAALLNEPIEGQGVFWSSAGVEKSSYPIPFRAFNFSDIYQRLPGVATATAPNSYAAKLNSTLSGGTAPSLAALPQPSPTVGLIFPNAATLSKQVKDAAAKAAADTSISAVIARDEFPLFLVEKWLKDSNIRKQGVQQFSVGVLTATLGLYGYGWELVSKPKKDGGFYRAVKKIDVTDGLKRLDAGEDPLSPDDESGDLDDSAAE